jgi:diguanylate cyclase (GGDEF)-like protein/putative nucleotidyltransferase with HDIG domain
MANGMLALGKDSSARLEATRRLHTAAAALDDVSYRATLARSIAFLFVAAASLSLAVLLALPHPEAYVAGVAATVGVAYGAALVILLSHARIAPAAYPWIVTLGTVLITLGIHFRATPTAAHALFYLWVILYSGYFLSRRATVIQLALAVAGYAVVLEYAAHPPQHTLEEWLLTFGSLVVACVLVLTLRRHVDDTVGGLADAARTDPLTGLLNRRGFEEAFELELERARRGDGKLSVVIGDLDHFKHVNDRFGHHVGDRALARTSEILHEEKRRIDTVARLGGEEFALIVPDTVDRRSFMLAERLRHAVRDEFTDDAVKVTVSFGVASFPHHGTTRQELLGAADDALYAAKELGRDRTVIYSREVVGVLTPANGRNGARNEQLATVLALADALDVRDARTARHSQTVARLAEITARELGLPEQTVEQVRLAGLLHDVGNIAVSNMLLSKPGPLSRAEWEEIRRHSEIGARILANARLGVIGQWVLAHHERVDGSGFPSGLASNSIPLEARILAVADAFEAMTSERAHRPALAREEAMVELRRNAGTQFDEGVVEVFIRALAKQHVRA